MPRDANAEQRRLARSRRTPNAPRSSRRPSPSRTLGRRWFRSQRRVEGLRFASSQPARGGVSGSPASQPRSFAMAVPPKRNAPRYGDWRVDKRAHERKKGGEPLVTNNAFSGNAEASGRPSMSRKIRMTFEKQQRPHTQRPSPFRMPKGGEAGSKAARPPRRAIANGP